MPFDWHIRRQIQRQAFVLPHTIFDFRREDPASESHALKVPSFDPLEALFRVPSLGPSPQGLEDREIDIAEGCLGHHMPVEVCPPPNHRIQLPDQILRFGCWLPFDCCSDLSKKVLRVCFRGFDQHLALVLTHILTEKIKAFFDMRDLGFLLRELQTSHLEKGCNGGFDLVLLGLTVRRVIPSFFPEKPNHLVNSIEILTRT